MGDYTDRYIKDALKAHKGDLQKVRRQLAQWAMEDERLLLDLVKPHLNGIIAYNVERVASGRSDEAKKMKPLDKLKGKAAGKNEKFGMEILKAVVDSDAIFGFDDQPHRRKSASQAHVDAITKLANTRKKNTKKDK